MITDPDDYFAHGCDRCARFDTPQCSALIWAGGQAVLRRLCLDAGLSEHAKWGHPTYMHAGRNICLITALQGDFRLVFMNASLMKDPEGVMVKQGAATSHPDAIKFTDNTIDAAMQATISAYLAEAMGYAEAGIRPEKVVREVEMPEELVEVLDADPEMAEAFAALTPGRQKSWALHVGGAKQSATRTARAERARDKVMAGKGQLER